MIQILLSQVNKSFFLKWNCFGLSYLSNQMMKGFLTLENLVYRFIKWIPCWAFLWNSKFCCLFCFGQIKLWSFLIKLWIKLLVKSTALRRMQLREGHLKYVFTYQSSFALVSSNRIALNVGNLLLEDLIKNISCPICFLEFLWILLVRKEFDNEFCCIPFNSGFLLTRWLVSCSTHEELI